MLESIDVPYRFLSLATSALLVLAAMLDAQGLEMQLLLTGICVPTAMQVLQLS